MAVVLTVVAGLAGFGLRWIFEKREEQKPAVPTTQVPKPYHQVKRSVGHVYHMREDVECRDCHGEGDFEPLKSSSCTGDCHTDVDEEVHPATTEETPECLGCHDFALDDEIAADHCMRCHSEPQEDSVEVARHASTECVRCHRPHEDPSLQLHACTSCHQETTTAHGRASLDDAEACMVCHDVHRDEAVSAETCAECHGKKGPRVVAARATFPGHDGCFTCHDDHSFSATAAKRCA
ncbi:MAG: hypothetical protein ACOC9T_01340, partial [Myxococcota bacterium]